LLLVVVGNVYLVLKKVGIENDQNNLYSVFVSSSSSSSGLNVAHEYIPSNQIAVATIVTINIMGNAPAPKRPD
jgi:hypothetical protein